MISSRENQWLRRFRAALGGRGASEGLIGLEGAHLVEEALRSGLRAEAVLVGASGRRHLEGLRPLLGGDARVLETSDRLFAGVAATETPQGIAALVRAPAAVFDDLVRGTALVVVLVGVQNPGNVGTIVRTAEAFGASGIATCSSDACGTANPFSPKAIRASAGSALRLPILHGVAASILLAQLRVAGVKLFAASRSLPSAGAARDPRVLDVWDADLRDHCAVLIGNEGAGLPGNLSRPADALVRIPLAAGVESLNAAVAAAVFLYEAARQRRAVPAGPR